MHRSNTTIYPSPAAHAVNEGRLTAGSGSAQGTRDKVSRTKKRIVTIPAPLVHRTCCSALTCSFTSLGSILSASCPHRAGTEMNRQKPRYRSCCARYSRLLESNEPSVAVAQVRPTMSTSHSRDLNETTAACLTQSSKHAHNGQQCLNRDRCRLNGHTPNGASDVCCLTAPAILPRVTSRPWSTQCHPPCRRHNLHPRTPACIIEYAERNLGPGIPVPVSIHLRDTH